MDIKRVIVLGHTGLIGSRVLHSLRTAHPALEARGCSLDSIDLSDQAASEALAKDLNPDTAVVMCAAVKRQLGDSLAAFRKNMDIVANFAELIQKNPVARVVYLSSAAVYGEDIENLAIDESAPLTPRTYYGLSKMSAEWILTQAMAQGAARSVGLVRPATLYGPGDLPTAYGPSLFLDAAVNARPVTLWGDGSELRELIYADDVGPILAAYVFSDHSGPLNLVSGTSYTFQDALAAVERVTGRKLEVGSRPRSKPKVDNRFDPSLLRTLVPTAKFTPLEEGIRQMHASRYATGAQERR
jgi:UDP-glucose 4-epimerase